jgi:hypothetical protein
VEKLQCLLDKQLSIAGPIGGSAKKLNERRKNRKEAMAILKKYVIKQ